MNAYLVTNLSKPHQKLIFIAPDPGTAKEKSEFKKAEVLKIADLATFLKHEKTLRQLFLGGSNAKK